MKRLFCSMAVIVALVCGCSTFGKPFFAFPSTWQPAVSANERSAQQAQFRKDDAECREYYFKGRDAGKTDSQSFEDRKKCMEDKGYRYGGRI